MHFARQKRDWLVNGPVMGGRSLSFSGRILDDRTSTAVGTSKSPGSVLGGGGESESCRREGEFQAYGVTATTRTSPARIEEIVRSNG